MEGDLFGLDFSVFDVDLVADEDNGNALANTSQILVPLWYISVGDTRASVEHNDRTLASDVVSITKASEFLLTSGVPHIEENLAMIGEEWHRVDLDSESGDVLLLEFSCQVTLHKGGLADTTVSDQDEFEFWNLLLCFNHLKEKN